MQADSFLARAMEFAERGQAAQKAVDAELDKVAKGPSKTRLINREHVRSFLLDRARETRAKKFTRVSEATLVAANEALRAWCVTYVARMPSKGETL